MRTRLFVWTFLVAFLAAGFLRIEAWPLTGWRLFSHVRGPERQTWHAFTVDANGEEQPVDLRRLGSAYRATVHVLATFPSLDDRRRAAACDAIAGGARRLGAEVRAVRVYEVVTDLRTSTRSSELRYVCADGTVSAT